MSPHHGETPTGRARSLDSQTMIGRQRRERPLAGARGRRRCRWAARPMMTTSRMQSAGVDASVPTGEEGFREALPERGRSGTRATPRAQVRPSCAGAVPSRRNWGHRHRFNPCDPVVGHGGAAEFPVPPTTDSLPACRSVPPPSNSLARCVVALYSPPTQIWWGRVLAEGSRPHRGRCPSRLLPMRALRRGCEASRHRRPLVAASGCRR